MMRAGFDVPSMYKITKKCAKYLKSIFVYIELMSSGQFEVWHLRTTSASMLANPAEERRDNEENIMVIEIRVVITIRNVINWSSWIFKTFYWAGPARRKLPAKKKLMLRLWVASNTAPGCRCHSNCHHHHDQLHQHHHDLIINVIIIMVLLTCNRWSHNGRGPTEHGEETERRGELVETKQVDQHDADGGDHDQGERRHNKG